ncbi:MAG: WD40 repeat protein [Mariniblastus sp.]|jgi:WD40 repeat protein
MFSFRQQLRSGSTHAPPTPGKRLRRLVAILGVAGGTCLTATVGQAQEAAEKVTYDDHVKPLLVQRCSSCHNGQKREGDLDVTNFTNLMAGGGSGTVIEPLDSANSFLYQLITHEESPEMPPSGSKIPEAEIQQIAKWIDLGALESMTSKAAKAKPKFDMAMSENPTARPEAVPMPLHIPLEPVVKQARRSVLAIATSPWAPVAAVSSPKQILLYNTQTLDLMGVLPIEEGAAHSLRFSRNGQLLLAGGGRGGASGKTILFNVLTGERITTAGDELESVLAADISPNHEYIAIGGPTKLVKILLTADGSLVAEIKKHTDWVTAIEFSPDGKLLATGDRNGGLQVWEAETGNEVFSLKGHSKAITGISWRADSQIVCSASEDTTIRVWELKNGKQVKSWTGHGGGVTAVEFLRDGNIASCGRDKLAKLWDQAGKMIKQFAGLSDVAVAVSYCDESNRMLAADWTGQLRVWNATDAVHVGNLITNPPRLAERLADAKTQLTAAQGKHAPLAQQAATTEASLAAVGVSLEQTKQSQVQIQTKLTTAEQQFNAAKQQLESTQAQHTLWRNELDQKKSAQPLLAELHTKTSAAGKILPDDAELKTSLAMLLTKKNQVDARVGELGALVAKSDQEKNTTQAQMAALGKTIAAMQTELETATTQITQLQNDIGTMTEQLQTEKASATAAQAEGQQATQQVQKWTAEISFIANLKALKKQLQQTEETVVARQTTLDAAHQELLDAQKASEEASRLKTEAKQQADDLKAQMMKLRGA